MRKTNYAPDADGRPRVHRSFVVDALNCDKMAVIANISGISAGDLLNELISQAVTEWERQHGELFVDNLAIKPDVNLSAALTSAKEKRDKRKTTRI